MSESTQLYYKRDIIRICENRGFRPIDIQWFLNTYDNMPYGYTIQMVDQFEYSINTRTMSRLHPDMIADEYHGFSD